MSKIIVRVLTALVLVCSLTSCLGLVACSSGQNAPSSSSSSVAQKQASVTVTIDATNAEGESTDIVVSIPEGSTALDALNATGCAVEMQDSSYGPFVVSVDRLANGDKGSQSGWMYAVNGESPAMSAGEYVVEDGDAVVWSFFV